MNGSLMNFIIKYSVFKIFNYDIKMYSKNKNKKPYNNFVFDFK